MVYGKLRQKELQYICIVNSLTLLDLIKMDAFTNVLQLPWFSSGPLIHTIFNHTQNIFPDKDLKMSFLGSFFHADLNGLTMPKKDAVVQQTALFQSLAF